MQDRSYGAKTGTYINEKLIQLKDLVKDRRFLTAVAITIAFAFALFNRTIAMAFIIAIRLFYSLSDAYGTLSHA